MLNTFPIKKIRKCNNNILFSWIWLLPKTVWTSVLNDFICRCAIKLKEIKNILSFFDRGGGCGYLFGYWADMVHYNVPSRNENFYNFNAVEANFYGSSVQMMTNTLKLLLFFLVYIHISALDTHHTEIGLCCSFLFYDRIFNL